ncbi:MAG: hypothetical protein J0665_05955 [Deltaproteobacteria bacterium]|jgi:hypothetical protein|nr:hypothetical protein [Deltaproteobacteria bacterium]
MGGCLTSLGKWFRLPTLGGFDQLDVQIDKLRTLRDSYQLPNQEYRCDRIADVKRICIQ